MGTHKAWEDLTIADDYMFKLVMGFVDGLPIQDAFVDEIRNLITELKHTEKEKVNYMTFQMRIDEERDEAREEGRREERHSGIRALIATMKELSVGQAQAVEQVMKRYSLSHEDAIAAVQSNW